MTSGGWRMLVTTILMLMLSSSALGVIFAIPHKLGIKKEIVQNFGQNKSLRPKFQLFSFSTKSSYSGYLTPTQLNVKQKTSPPTWPRRRPDWRSWPCFRWRVRRETRPSTRTWTGWWPRWWPAPCTCWGWCTGWSSSCPGSSPASSPVAWPRRRGWWPGCFTGAGTGQTVRTSAEQSLPSLGYSLFTSDDKHNLA